MLRRLREVERHRVYFADRKAQHVAKQAHEAKQLVKRITQMT